MPLTANEAALETKAEKIARIITRNYGVNIRVEGGQAYTDLLAGEIVLPNLNELQWQKIDNILDGFLDHECAHVIYTEKDLVIGITNKTLHLIWNVIEDTWIEREMSAVYPGCQSNIRRLLESVTAYQDSQWQELEVLNRLGIAFGRCWRGIAVVSDFYGDDLIGELIKYFSDEIDIGYKVRTTASALELAKKILAKLNQPMPDKELAEQPGDSGEGEADLENDSGQIELKLSESDGNDQSDGEELRKQLAEAVNNMGEEFKDQSDIEGFLNNEIDVVEKDLTGNQPNEYLVFSNEFDRDFTYSVDERASYTDRYTQLQDQVRQYVGTMSSQLEMSLLAEQESRWVGGSLKGRKFDKRRLPGWLFGGGDDRIFTQLESGEKFDTAIVLLWDCSGSMGNNSYEQGKANLARLSAIAFHEALLRANIPHEILGFNSGGPDIPALRSRIENAMQRGEDISKYSRLSDIDNRFVYVPFGQSDGRAIVNISGSAANRDGECVLWAAKRLAARPESRKILIVGSDGMPAGAIHPYTEEIYLQKVIQQIVGAGIEIYGIGIKSKSVSKYYPHWVVVDRIEDLPKVILSQLGQMLITKRGSDNVRLPGVQKTSGHL